jgi:aspartyl-tRNA(Asn)/glutamyl-tRNA(Gln) amidotransferase subunit B
MARVDMKAKYIPTIGIECHVQFKTITKLFSGVNNDAREASPNSLVSHICFGLPGSLPVLNKEAIHLATRAAFVLGTTPEHYSIFDRKHYFYPDLPKGYQITQYAQPIIGKGFIKIEVDGVEKIIGVTRAHLEEDAGKNTHPSDTDYSLVDLNRAGTPLLEIVSEPDMHSAAEARAYVRELYLGMKFAGVSDANLYYGNMRFDVNVSVSKDDNLGTRTETKNLNSFRAVEKAIEYEIDRQIELLESGEKIIQETLGWDEEKQRTISQRSKEEAHDYRYFPEPDLPPIVIEEDFINKIRQELPIMPIEWRSRLKKLGIDQAHIETLLDAEADNDKAGYMKLIESAMDDSKKAGCFANWQVNVEIPLHKRDDRLTYKDLTIKQRIFNDIYNLMIDGKLNSSRVKDLLTLLLTSTDIPENIESLAKDKGFVQVSDEAELVTIVKKVLSTNEQAATDIKKGELRAIGFIVGQVMQATKGRANPELTQKIIRDQLDIH